MSITSDLERVALDDFRKILAFAASAGKTITADEALDVIKALARRHVIPSTWNEAIARHVERVREILRGSFAARELVAHELGARGRTALERSEELATGPVDRG